jgi:hypothetical protein
MVTTSNYGAIANSHTQQVTTAHILSLLSLLYLHQFSGNGFQRRTFPKFPRPQLPTSHSNSSQLLNPSTPLSQSLTNQLIQLSITVLRITPRHGPHRKHRSSVAVRLLLSDGMAYSTAACAAIGNDRAQYTIPLFLFTGRCLVTGLHVRFNADRHSNIPDEHISGLGYIPLY